MRSDLWAGTTPARLPPAVSSVTSHTRRNSKTMTAPASFPIGPLDVTVEESAESLRYTFTPRDPGRRPGFPVFLTLLFVVLPIGLIGLVGYSLNVTGADRPTWELALTALL